MKKKKFKFKQYQREDIAVASMVDGLTLGWDPGMGKTIASYTIPLLWETKLNLMVAPDSLHEQMIAEAMKFFGIEVKPLRTLQDAYDDEAIMEALCGRRPGCSDEPRFYVTSYTQLGFNGADERAPRIKRNTRTGRDEMYLPDNIFFWREKTESELGVEGDWRNVGEAINGIQCVHIPSMATALSEVFDAVICDEATRIKGDTTLIAQGVRKMNPRKRLVLTGTPMKNCIGDIFWLCQWASGGNDLPTPRWPYENSLRAKQEFSDRHTVKEENITKAAAYRLHHGTTRRFVKPIPELTHTHLLWKTLAPNLIRRRKTEIGAEIAGKTFVPVKVRPGDEQLTIIQGIVDGAHAEKRHDSGMNPMAEACVLLGELRHAALFPARFTKLRDPSDRMNAILTPKDSTVLNLTAKCLQEGEQVIIFSPFVDWSTWITNALIESGVSAVRLDGETSPQKRGKFARDFKHKKYSVLVAGLKSMGEGHSFEQCKYAIMPSLDWAFDVNAQAIDRVHRITSPEDVTIYMVQTEGSFDEEMNELFARKMKCINMALDASQEKVDRIEINLQEILRQTLAGFDPQAPVISQAELREQWPVLEATLLDAEREFRSKVNLDSGEIHRPRPKTPDIKSHNPKLVDTTEPGNVKTATRQATRKKRRRKAKAKAIFDGVILKQLIDSGHEQIAQWYRDGNAPRARTAQEVIDLY